MQAFEKANEELEGFTLSDAEIVKNVYVCSQCEGCLEIVPVNFIEPDGRFYVICPDDGNIEQIGRISKTTVAIRNERGVFDFIPALKALPDLWGELYNAYMKTYHTPLREGETPQERNLRELGF
jgi:hypothetical protein